MMEIYPAIDISEGKCVRLLRGDMKDKTIYGDNPVEMAKKWAGKGAAWIHVVDLDGATSGGVKNMSVIKNIVNNANVKIQVGGGIRDKDTVKEMLNEGVSRVVLGTKAVEDEKFVEDLAVDFSDKLAISLDAKGDKIATEGWVETVEIRPVQIGRKYKQMGISTFIYTQILKDGTLEGPDLERLKDVAVSIGGGVIASGGIGNLDDVKNVISLENFGIEGMIIGKALYENKFDLAEAIAMKQNKNHFSGWLST